MARSLLLLLLGPATSAPLQLHLGCNTRNFGPEWVHVDAAHHPHVSSHNLRTLPYDNGSASIIYASHVFEYFDREEAMDVLAEWLRVLAPGGVLRLAVPDFEAVARLYLDESTPVTLDTFVSMLFGKWTVGADGDSPDGEHKIYHRTTYDRASLTRLLERAGFEDVRRWQWQRVSHGHVDDLSQAYWPHMHKENGTLVSLNLEASKPGGRNAPDAAALSAPASWSLTGEPRPAHGPSHTVLRYDTSAFPFAAHVANAIGVAVDDLDSLRPQFSATSADLTEDWHLRRFYEAIREPGSPLVAAYERFVRHIYATLHSDEELLIFQAKPSLRIQYPGAVVVPDHRDGDPDDAAHPPGEINFLLPVTHMRRTASMRIESSPGACDFAALELSPGDLLRFDGNNCTHGNDSNVENFTRLSLDFRLLRPEAYATTLRHRAAAGLGPAVSLAKPNVSSHRQISFVVGDYYRAMWLSSNDDGGAVPRLARPARRACSAANAPVV